MFISDNIRKILLFLSIISVTALTGCLTAKTESKTPTLLKVENASQDKLLKEIDRFAAVKSMRAKIYLKFEDNSFAQFGSKEVYRQADGEIVVQRPSSILLKVQVPVIKSDIAQMTSDGEKFRVAILNDGGSGKYKSFVKGTNSADYTPLKKSLNTSNGDATQNVNAFSELRPQHFTDAMLVKPTSPENLYVQSTIYQTEEDLTLPKKSPLRRVTRGYYLLDEYGKNADGQNVILRRFWFDRVSKIRLARQQIFDAAGEIDSDITYGATGPLGSDNSYGDLPLLVQVTRMKEKYSMRITYQVSDQVKLGESFPEEAFVLENSWNLREEDLDKRLGDALQNSQTQPQSGVSQGSPK